MYAGPCGAAGDRPASVPMRIRNRRADRASARGLAQLVEHRTRTSVVVGSNPAPSLGRSRGRPQRRARPCLAGDCGRQGSATGCVLLGSSCRLAARLGVRGRADRVPQVGALRIGGESLPSGGAASGRRSGRRLPPATFPDAVPPAVGIRSPVSATWSGAAVPDDSRPGFLSIFEFSPMPGEGGGSCRS